MIVRLTTAAEKRNFNPTNNPGPGISTAGIRGWLGTQMPANMPHTRPQLLICLLGLWIRQRPALA
jgi:hypothetical protein